MAWYHNQHIKLPEPKYRSAYGRYEANKKKALKQGLRYKRWSEVKDNWHANAGISRPYDQFIKKGPKQLQGDIYHSYYYGDTKRALELVDLSVKKSRESIKAVFGDDCSVILDANGSCVISTISKMLRGAKEDLHSVTFSDQGRLVYSALGFEAKSVTHFRQNFDQPIALFDAPAIKNKIQTALTYSNSVSVIDVFHKDNTYKSDGLLMDDFVTHLKKRPDISLAMLLHVSRTGRILPVEEMIVKARELRPDIALFVDGCQAIGRVPYSSVRNVFSLADGYVFVGHKALGSMICGAAAIKKDIEKKFSFLIENSLLHKFKLFQFESDEINLKILKRSRKTGKRYFLISAPEALSLALALDDNVQNYWDYQNIIGKYKYRLTTYLQSVDGIKFNVHSHPAVDDIISFHTEPIELGRDLKAYLQNLQPAITLSPLTENTAVRIAIDPKLEKLDKSMEYLMDSLDYFFRCNR